MPFLEGLALRGARAGGISPNPFAIFFRQANGVASAQTTTEIGMEPERFWPRQVGPLTAENVEGRAVGELADHLDRLLIVGNVKHAGLGYWGAHSSGALQSLTGQGPVKIGSGVDPEADGESLDHRIGRELNDGGRDSLFLYSGQIGGDLGGPCISYRGPGQRRAAIHDPLLAYQIMMGLEDQQLDQIIARQRSANDYVRDRLTTLRNSEKLSSDDRRRLDLHLQAVRDLENALTCTFSENEQKAVEGLSPGFASTDGDEVLAAAKAHLQVAALAVACGYTRSVTVQVGSGNDASTRYRHPDTGELMESYHYISHRRRSHTSSGGDPIPGSDLLHHLIDKQFAQTFGHLLDLLSSYELPNDERLIDRGVSVWYNDLANGPDHSGDGPPWVLAGSAGGFLEQGQYLELEGAGGAPTLGRLLNTIGSAAGLRKTDGALLDDFGDDRFDRTPSSKLMA